MPSILILTLICDISKVSTMSEEYMIYAQRVYLEKDVSEVENNPCAF